jgi:hypothetical protein
MPGRGALPDLPRERRPAGQVSHRPILSEIDPTGRILLRQLLSQQALPSPLPTLARSDES